MIIAMTRIALQCDCEGKNLDIGGILNVIVIGSFLSVRSRFAITFVITHDDGDADEDDVGGDDDGVGGGDVVIIERHWVGQTKHTHD